MMTLETKLKIKYYFSPLFSLYSRLLDVYYISFAKSIVEKRFFRVFGRQISWNNPKDLNEKINWLKFHADLQLWANLADKYKVREYLADKGLSDILIPLYGKWDSVESFMDAWDQLPDDFVIKSNNGCGHVIIVRSEDGGKARVDKKSLKIQLTNWIREKNYGVKDAEFHYRFIKNCIIVEKLLKDPSIADFSASPIDYKFHCCDGKPYLCYVSYGRSLSKDGSHKRVGNLYDLQWTPHPELMSETEERKLIPKPLNWERMISIAECLSSGLPQSRVDLYNIQGEIYFGEITLTSASGFDDEYIQQVYIDLGDKVTLDLDSPLNSFSKKSFR